MSTALNENETIACKALNFDELVRRCMGRIELAERLLSSFDQRFPVELAEIERCLLAGDAPTAARLSHQLKGASGNVSAVALHAVASQIEHAVRSGDLNDARSRLVDAHQAWDEYQSAKSSLSRRTTK
jgi:HPt (histidine-containing phosphotransfer) domain-containing protein